MQHSLDLNRFEGFQNSSLERLTHKKIMCLIVDMNNLHAILNKISPTSTDTFYMINRITGTCTCKNGVCCMFKLAILWMSIYLCYCLVLIMYVVHIILIFLKYPFFGVHRDRN